MRCSAVTHGEFIKCLIAIPANALVHKGNVMTGASRQETGKNIVVFSDGTGQEGGAGSNSNVYKLFTMVEDRTSKQVAFYDAGLGTNWQKWTGSISGAGITKNILECYQFISDQYQWGDRIFLFGFSRGAATVRSLSGFISRFGILPHSRPDLVKQAWAIYKQSDQANREKDATAFLQRNTTTWCNIDFVGVWDTVAALGLPNKGLSAVLNKIPGLAHRFHDLKLSKCVQHAYHAISIDEDRRDFRPTPFQTEENGVSTLGEVFVDPRDGDGSEQAGKQRQQTARQVWFAGVHTDVGGGYPEKGLSDISLTWMIDRAMDEKVLEHPLRLFPYSNVEIVQDIEGVIHSERATWDEKLMFAEGRRSWDADIGGNLVVHQSVLQRKKGVHGHESTPYTPWILKGLSEDQYEVEPWDNQDRMYSIPVELGYRRDPVP